MSPKFSMESVIISPQQTVSIFKIIYSYRTELNYAEKIYIKMTLNGKLDIMLHLGSFRSIDLLDVGLYRLRFKLMHLVPGVHTSGNPYMTFPCAPNSSRLVSSEVLVRSCTKSEVFYS